MIRMPRAARVVLGRLGRFWVYGTGPSALLLLLLAPALLPGRSLPFVLSYFALPAYMVHQVEEYDASLLGRRIGGFLSPLQANLGLGQIAVINLGFAWVPLALTLWLVIEVEPGWAVLAAWLMLGNAALHIGTAALRGRYNPGLGTALVLFVPLGGAILERVPATPSQHVGSLLAVVLLHLLVVAVAHGPRGGRAP